ncbi:MAG: hypothetical protein QOD92_3643 [Acidimicrobiaceae bacterium]|jgi:hypothetical protein
MSDFDAANSFLADPGPEPQTDRWASTWTDPNGGEWTVETRWAVVDGALQCVHIAFTAKDDAQPVSTYVLRSPLAPLLEEHRIQVAGNIRYDVMSDYLEIGQVIDVGGRKKFFDRGGSPLSPDEVLRAIATAYRNAVEGGFKNPVAVVAEWFGFDSVDAAEQRIRRARRKGYLDPPAMP